MINGCVMNITFRHFEIVDAVIKCQSITRAASMLEMTQPGLTRAIKTLEDQIEKDLFIRTPRGLEPSEAALIILKRYTNIASGLASIISEIEQIKSLNGSKLTLAASIIASHTSVYEAVGRMNKKYKKLEFNISQKDWQLITKDILAGDIELGIMELGTAEFDPVFETELLNTDPIYFYARAGHPLANHDTLTLDQLKQYPLCCWPLPPSLKEYFGDNLGAFGRYDPLTGVLQCAIDTYDFLGIRQVVANSDALGLAPRAMLNSPFIGEDLVILDKFEAPWLQARYGFVHLRQTKLSPATVEFMALVRDIELEKQKQAEPPALPTRKSAKR